MESVMGLKESLPEKAIAVTTVGEARKFIVSLLPSLRDLKFRLKDVKMAAKKSIGIGHITNDWKKLTILLTLLLLSLPLSSKVRLNDSGRTEPHT